MQSEKHLDTAVLGYLLLLIILVVSNMIKNINMIDVIYFITLVCCVLKYFLVFLDNRK